MRGPWFSHGFLTRGLCGPTSVDFAVATEVLCIRVLLGGVHRALKNANKGVLCWR